MNVRTLCLAMLAIGESTGYDIRKRASEGSYRHFAEASFGSIYPALAKLEAEGCVMRREETAPGRPARKIYSITPKGEAEFREALSAPAQRDVFRSPFLMVALCAQFLRPEEVEAAIDRQVRHLREDLAEIEQEVREGTTPGGEWVERFARQTIDASLDFLTRHRDELVRIAGGDVEPGMREAFVEAAE